MEEKNKTFMCSLDEQQCQQECEHKYDRTFCQFATLIEPQSPAPQSVDKEGVLKNPMNIATDIWDKTNPMATANMSKASYLVGCCEGIKYSRNHESSELRKENEELRGINEGLRLSRKEYMDGFNRKVEEFTLLQSTNDELKEYLKRILSGERPDATYIKTLLQK